MKTIMLTEETCNLHPGELLKKELDLQCISQRKLALMIDRPYQAINEIVRCKKSITANTAIEFEYALGIDATFWMHQQADYDLLQAREVKAMS